MAQSPTPAGVAQGGDGGYQTSTIVMALPESCPVNLQAKQAGMTDMVKVKDGEKRPEDMAPGPRQRIYLIIGKDGVTAADKVGPVKVASATVTVRGLSARSRMNDALHDGSAASDIRRILYVKFAEAENGTAFADLILPGFTAVNSVKLESITFADGSTHVPGRAACKVVPDPIMLVADR